MTADMTPLDLAHAAMEAAPDDDAARLRFYERLADGEMFVLLEAEHSGGESLSPRLFDSDGAQFVLIFDRETRLAEFAGGIAPYAALSGRVVAQMLAGKGVGVGVNLNVAPSQILLPAEAVDWLHATLGAEPEEALGAPEEIMPPRGLPESLIVALDTKLAIAGGLARAAYLAGVRYDTGAQSHLLAFVDHVPGSEGALARLVHEALIFSGVEAGVLDVAFFRPTDPLCAPLARHGLRFDLPVPEAEPSGPAAPGMDPARPPKLK
ncbi:hypothetical protein AQS8620_01152 [Aquimixticola soesokkakensis]|uniref:SseB protein N-terminal domain-containing protein n=1 Tax=Aquimixticola soesokkakensis TaxID=1519096 RepID=A0A1Y5S6F4_9RHOB|nr:SseB family protein [Aquimixticola soesokkakensis]SLN33505.1 hypothetical protein AQS8620_01152 [Aquimixticola soesokkakensis]